MSAQPVATSADPDRRSLYRAGAVSALVLGVSYIVIIALYASVGVPPSDGEAWLKYGAGKTAAWWGIIGLSILTDVLFVPIALSLYVALEGVSKNLMRSAAAFVLLFVVLDLAVTWPNIAALVTLSDKYAAAVTDAQRTVDVAAANYASAVLRSTLAGVYSIVTLSLGILMAGIVMIRAHFDRSAAYVGVATGVLGVVSVAGPLVVSALAPTIIVASLLTTLWVLLVGYRLYRLGQG
jgi:hypothetical protein